MTFSDDTILCLACGCPVDFSEPVIKTFLPRVGEVFFCSVACYHEGPQEAIPEEEPEGERSNPFIEEDPL